MTNEEAVKYLIAPIATSTEPSAEYLKQKEAYDRAVKALETGEVYMTGEDYNLYMEGYKAGKRDFQPKQGEWIDHSEEGYVECPICNCLTSCDDNIDELHYCWNCGAKMGNGGAEWG